MVGSLNLLWHVGGKNFILHCCCMGKYPSNRLYKNFCTQWDQTGVPQGWHHTLEFLVHRCTQITLEQIKIKTLYIKYFLALGVFLFWVPFNENFQLFWPKCFQVGCPQSPQLRHNKCYTKSRKFFSPWKAYNKHEEQSFVIR